LRLTRPNTAPSRKYGLYDVYKLRHFVACFKLLKGKSSLLESTFLVSCLEFCIKLLCVHVFILRVPMFFQTSSRECKILILQAGLLSSMFVCCYSNGNDRPGAQITKYLTIYHKIIVRSTYDSDLKSAKISFRNTVT